MSDDAAVLEAALKVMSLAMDEFVSACMDEQGKPRAPSAGSLAKARGFLPPYCVNAFNRKGGAQ